MEVCLIDAATSPITNPTRDAHFEAHLAPIWTLFWTLTVGHRRAEGSPAEGKWGHRGG